MGKIAKRGRPKLESKTEPDQVTGRMKEWCDFVIQGYSEEMAGRMVSPIAQKEQIVQWKKNEAVIKYFELHRRQPSKKTDEVQHGLYTEVENEVLIGIRKDAKAGTLNDKLRESIMQPIMNRMSLTKRDPKQDEIVGQTFDELWKSLPEEAKEEKIKKPRRRTVGKTSDSDKPESG